MALPKINTPYYDMKLPSSGETVRYRPFLVKEEKLLLMAMEGGKQEEVSRTLQQIITNCTDGKVDVHKLPMFDVEYLFLQLRIKSVEDFANIQVKCKACANSVGSKVDLNKVKVKFPEKEVNFKVQLNSDIGVILKYPTMDMVRDIQAADAENTEYLFDLISSCIESIYDEEQVYNEFNKKEIDEFIESLPQEAFKNISDFFENVPKLQHDIKFACPKCKEKNTVTVTGLQDFFESASLTTI